jgi:hypothetical protein
MKLNLTVGGFPLNGYLNIDPLSKENQHGIDNIDDLVDNNECEEVLAYGVIDIFPLDVKRDKLAHWASKVEHHGFFIFSGTDLGKISRLIVDGLIDSRNSNVGLYGNPANPWTTKRSLWTVEEAKQAVLSMSQFNIASIEFSGIEYVIKAQRT